MTRCCLFSVSEGWKEPLRKGVYVVGPCQGILPAFPEPVIPLETPFPSPPHSPPPATFPGSPGTGVLNMELGVSGPLHAGQVLQLKDLKFTNILVEREL